MAVPECIHHSLPPSTIFVLALAFTLPAPLSDYFLLFPLTLFSNYFARNALPTTNSSAFIQDCRLTDHWTSSDLTSTKPHPKTNTTRPRYITSSDENEYAAKDLAQPWKASCPVKQEASPIERDDNDIAARANIDRHTHHKTNTSLHHQQVPQGASHRHAIEAQGADCENILQAVSP
ncbi:uncharacterized protein FTJAE_5035 [Fusarium tjaetaba]|uniref:Uncharacterized protein n=1 Tax=Fusarium tjaetaba TaxID=1567544 RepID=A0A8H5RSE7_9HYPO|nr:uncharacterized protein FTJAE_5035 [Fusarium tjaetaba]KAF5638964.1 hypothetical protein FTJAE_5035 [Fusarium tjaetaba]